MRYGWRARVGHVSPAIVDTQAEECRKLLPPGVLHQVLSVSEPVQAVTPDQLARAGGLMVEAARRLAAEEADVIVAGGAPASAGRGPAADDELIAAMREATRLPCTTANHAVVEALELLGLRRIVVASPFVEARNDDIRSYLAACGVEVVAARGLGIEKNIQMAKQSPDAAYQLAHDLVRANPTVDGVYIACPRWPVVDVIEALEADVRKPVVAGVTAMMWHALRLIDVGDPPRGYGRLMETLRG
jgi:maleate cis-trans isomerase